VAERFLDDWEVGPAVQVPCCARPPKLVRVKAADARRLSCGCDDSVHLSDIEARTPAFGKE
jgi:hypothetical protein